MFTLSKSVWFLLEPSNLLTLVAALGIILRRYRLALAAALGLLVAGLSPLGALLLAPLEGRFPAYVEDGAPVAGVVVLGGGVSPEISAAHGQMALKDAGDRIVALIALGARHPQAALIFTGGSSNPDARNPPEADVVARHLPTLAPALRVTYENASRNTQENAVFARRLAAPKPGERWLLVTSAFHMPRAMGLFRKAGWEMTAYPVDYRQSGVRWPTGSDATVADGLRRTGVAMKEWVGLVFARLAGQSESLFPAP